MLASSDGFNLLKAALDVKDKIEIKLRKIRNFFINFPC
jgi:hypothetical protein